MGNKIINDGLFVKLINFHKSNKQRESELLEKLNIPLRNDKMSCQSSMEAVLKTEKLFESQSKTEKNILLEKAPEPSLIEISPQRKPRIVFKRCFLCNSPNHLARK